MTAINPTTEADAINALLLNKNDAENKNIGLTTKISSKN